MEAFHILERFSKPLFYDSSDQTERIGIGDLNGHDLSDHLRFSLEVDELEGFRPSAVGLGIPFGRSVDQHLLDASDIDRVLLRRNAIDDVYQTVKPFVLGLLRYLICKLLSRVSLANRNLGT